MKKSINISLLLLLATTITGTAQGQNSITIMPGAAFKITSGTSVVFDGLMIKPSVDFSLSDYDLLYRDLTPYPTLPPSSFIQRIYHFSKTQNAFSGELGIYYNDDELNGLDEHTMAFNIYDGSAWKVYNTNLTSDATNNLVTVSGLSNVFMSELTLGSATALPVSLTVFDAQLNQCTAKLVWTTASEQNMGYFEVQTSEDGVSFTKVGTVKATGNSSTDKSYAFNVVMDHPSEYFRLLLMENTGVSHLSKVRQLQSNCSLNTIAVFPNPATNVINLTGLSGVNKLILMDVTGRILKTQSSANQTDKISVADLASGLYIIQVIQNGKVLKSVKILKK